MARIINPPPDSERCEALLMDMYLRPTDDRCGHLATVVVNGRQLCSKHAGPYALTLMLEKGEAKRIPRQRMVLSEMRFAGESSNDE